MIDHPIFHFLLSEKLPSFIIIISKINLPSFSNAAFNPKLILRKFNRIVDKLAKQIKFLSKKVCTNISPPTDFCVDF